MMITVTEFNNLIDTVTHDLTLEERLALYRYCRGRASYSEAERVLREVGAGVVRFANLLAATGVAQ